MKRWLLPMAMVLLAFCVAPPANAVVPSVVYTTADSTVPLHITAPGTYDGQHHRVPSIFIQANGVNVRNFVVSGGTQAGIWSDGYGNNITDNDISQIGVGGGYLAGIIFFGNGSQILRNTVHNLVRGSIGTAHPRAVQTFTNGHSGSAGITIADNQWVGSDFQECVMAEGPASTAGGGGGPGISSSWTIQNNRCAGTANAAIVLRGITVVSVNTNNFDGHDNEAVQVANGSTAYFSGNTLGPYVKKLSGP